MLWRGEAVATYLTKGKQVYIEGRLQSRSYDDKDGNKRKATEVVIDNMQMLGSRRDSGASGEEEFAPVGARAAAPASGASDGFGGDDLDDEIPF